MELNQILRFKVRNLYLFCNVKGTIMYPDITPAVTLEVFKLNRKDGSS